MTVSYLQGQRFRPRFVTVANAGMVLRATGSQRLFGPVAPERKLWGFSGYTDATMDATVYPGIAEADDRAYFGR